MSIDIQIQLVELLKVEGVVIKAETNSRTLPYDMYEDLRDTGAPADLGYAKWCMEADTYMKLPGYPYWRGYSIMMTDQDQDLLVCFSGVGSTSGFTSFIRELCATHGIKHTEY
jgi:hypothetical protein